MSTHSFPTFADDDRCACTSTATFATCCKPYLTGEKVAPTAVALMRSRFSAFVTGNADYLLSTWLQETAPETLMLDPRVEFYRLDIVGHTQGGPFDTMGTVHFEAFYRVGDTVGSQVENSTFGKAGGRWYYIGEA
ncbi:hypothetical protein C1Y63_02805 [Corynebacterium sp. 13CS0277]|uniref:YchJ family protein n=1 Tax=Corynebacterium sp. 13CS0277 TaxID=2071994 RepID=UPI000D03E54E|nr:YchJ family metal-binding protein [Corynebacterium sp. 13CS0277]PRQ12022.1 hypothetical protein C1Y63_02805 [Corynebacterium sp. 13CS0277]